MITKSCSYYKAQEKKSPKKTQDYEKGSRNTYFSALRAKKMKDKGQDTGKVGRPCYLTEDEELQLVETIVNWNNIQTQPTYADIPMMALHIRLQRDSKIKDYVEAPSLKWVRDFVSRHKQLKPVDPVRLNIARVRASTTENIQSFLSKLRFLMKTKKYHPSLILQLDETSCQSNERQKRKNIVSSNCSYLPVLESPPLRHLTMLFIVTANGKHLPSHLLLTPKYENEIRKQWNDEDFILHTSQKGWMTKEIFQDIMINYVLSYIRKQRLEVKRLNNYLLSTNSLLNNKKFEIKEGDSRIQKTIHLNEIETAQKENKPQNAVMNKDEEIITKCDDCSKTTGYALKDSLKTHELHFHPDQPADELLGVTKALTESPKDELQRCNEADKSSNDKQESKITEDNEITSFKMIKHDGFIGCEEEESNLIRDIPDYFSEVIRRKREIIDDEKWWLEESFSTQTKKNSCCSFCDNQRKMTVSEEEEEENNPPALIILDGHASRHNINLWKMFSSANVDVVVLPSHTSHILQPLDLGPNAELKKQLKRIKNEPTIRKMQTQFLPFVESITECAYMALAPMTIKHGFFEAGITSATIHHVLNKTIRELPPGMKKITQGNRWSISGKCITSDLVIQEWEEYEKARNNNAKIQQKLNNLKNKHLKCKPLTNKKRRKDAVVSETSENDLDSEQVEVGKIMGKSDSDISEYGSDESDSQAGEDSVISIPIFGIRESKESIENPIFRDRKEEKEESSEEAVLTKDCASLLSRETESENESDLLTVKKQRMKRKNDDSDYDYEKEKTDSASSEELDDLPKIYGTRSLRINKFHNDYVSS